jgi:hypothetical protein
VIFQNILKRFFRNKTSCHEIEICLINSTKLPDITIVLK